IFGGLYTLVLYRRNLLIAKAIFLTQFKAAAAAIATLFLQLSVVFGPAAVIQDFGLTFFARNDPDGLAAQRLMDFFTTHNIVFWDNIFDISAMRNHVALIRSQTHFNFQVYTPIPTLVSVIVLLAWLFEYWREVEGAARKASGAICFYTL